MFYADNLFHISTLFRFNNLFKTHKLFYINDMINIFNTGVDGGASGALA